jgi:hypothetical protein
MSGWSMQLEGVNETERCSDVSYTQQKLQSFIKYLNNIWDVACKKFKCFTNKKY